MYGKITNDVKQNYNPILNGDIFRYKITNGILVKIKKEKT